MSAGVTEMEMTEQSRTPRALGSRQVAVIGAGNIGSRHLQGLTLSRIPLDVHVIEKSPAAVALSRERFDDAAKANASSDIRCDWLQDIGDLPQDLDVAIIATGAAQRRAVLEELLAHASVRFLILEKFLFQRCEDYTLVSELLDEKNVKAFVNTPRRSWPAYQALKERIPENVPVHLKVEIAQSNGLATNAVHMVDLLGFLARDRSEIVLRGEKLVFAAKESRHVGMLEFDGLLEGETEAGDTFSMKAPAETDHAPTIIEAGGLVYKVDESSQQLDVLKDGVTLERSSFPILFQSQLSGSIVDQLLLHGHCSLPDYALSSRYHLACIDAFSSAEFRLTGKRQPICHIT